MENQKLPTNNKLVHKALRLMILIRQEQLTKEDVYDELINKLVDSDLDKTEQEFIVRYFVRHYTRKQPMVYTPHRRA